MEEVTSIGGTIMIDEIGTTVTTGTPATTGVTIKIEVSENLTTTGLAFKKIFK